MLTKAQKTRKAMKQLAHEMLDTQNEQFVYVIEDFLHNAEDETLERLHDIIVSSAFPKAETLDKVLGPDENIGSCSA